MSLASASHFDVHAVRAQFPALTRPGAPIYFDNAAGTQVVQTCIDDMTRYLVEMNANSHGVFETSRRSDACIDDCRAAVADFVNAEHPDEVAFGGNMTTLTQIFARGFGRDLGPGDEIITTRIEHEANVSPWLALEERGVKVRFVALRPDDVTLDLDSLASVLSERTRLVAVGRASNAFGTVHPVAEVARMAHSVGALCFVDAVHYSPHGPIDVQALGCDVLVFSAYKMFGPHLGVLWGRREVLERVRPYHLRTVPPECPGKYETGTQNNEGISGLHGALRYLESLSDSAVPDRQTRLRDAMERVRQVEETLSLRLLDLFASHRDVRVHGITDPGRVSERVPTFAITVAGHHPLAVAEHLAAANINSWNGNNYALEPMTALGLEASGGAVRISPVHYNTFEEIDALDRALGAL
ncbi:MAG: cysteine desulfurase-like protein [Proteobacteria bacterium]|nr:cysteine desulfurase-like protein [Pseudomonadota bacterium]